MTKICRSLIPGYIVFGFFCAFSAYADEVNVATRATNIVSAWEQWASSNKVKSTSVAVFYEGELIASSGKNREPEKPYPVASLSKTITGICTLQYLEESAFNLKSTLSDVLGDQLNDKKIKKLETKSALTIGMLLNQTTGLKKDITQKKGLTKYSDFGKPHIESVSVRALRQKTKAAPGKKHIYNNGNFAILGWVIETISGKPYEQACLEKTLIPAGVTNATLNPEWRVMSSWGGWMISAIDYGKFIDTYFTDQKVLGKPPIRYGRGLVKEGVKYGAGFYWRDTKKGYNFWHYGRWKWSDKKRRANLGAVFWHFSPGWTITGNYGLSPNKTQSRSLEKAVFKALKAP